MRLSDYPDLGEFIPFKTWNESQPTRSLPWYDSYNATKHHREAEFSKASFLNLLNAMSALHIMSAAQWGPAPYGPLGTISPSTFTIRRAPKIPLSEVYMPSIDGKGTLISSIYFER